MQNTRFPILLAMIFGLCAPLIPGIFNLRWWAILLYFVGSGILAIVWPGKTWQWGLWVCLPIIVLSLLSVFFVGQFDVFMKKDFPVLMTILGAACAGGFIFPLVKNLIIKRSS